MTKPIDKTLIGAFIAGAIVVLIVGVLFLGGGHWFGETTKYVLYFSGSVRGLSLGAPVKLKGIPIGSVTGIRLVYNRDSNSFINQVVFEVKGDPIKETTGTRDVDSAKKRLTTDVTIDQMIETGLRAKLQLRSFITGQLLVDCDFYPNSPVTLMSFDDAYQEIPTLPSDLDELAKTMDAIDLQAIATSVQNVIAGVETLITSPELIGSLSTLNETLKRYRQLALTVDRHVEGLSSQVNAAVTDTRRLIERAAGQLDPVTSEVAGLTGDVRKILADLDRRLPQMLDNTQATTAAARHTLEQASTLFANLTYLTDEHAPLIYRLDTALVEVRKAAGALALVAEYLSRHPEALLRGKQPPAAEGN